MNLVVAAVGGDLRASAPRGRRVAVGIEVAAALLVDFTHGELDALTVEAFHFDLEKEEMS